MPWRVTAPLRGSPEELIAEVRVAAFRLVAPERLVGSIAILSDVPEATVTLDGVDAGKTPLAQPLANLPMGVHKLTVTREGFTPFSEDVPVRFEKTTQVVVHQAAVSEKAKRAERRRLGELPIYTKWWFWTAMAVSAVATGIGVGYAISESRQAPVDCTQGCR